MTKDRVRLDDRVRQGSYTAGDATAVPVPVDAHRAEVVAPAGRRWPWLRAGLRIVRNAAIAVALMTLVPVWAIRTHGNQESMRNWASNTRERSVFAERMRPYDLPKDQSITAVQAGQALNTLIKPVDSVPSAFRRIAPVRQHVMPWESVTAPPDLFPGAQPSAYSTPMPEIILRGLKGFNTRELEYLEKIATAAFWEDVGTVARAPAVDIVGGRYQLPLPADATFERMPARDIRQLREIASAGSARAAWFMSKGQLDSAEAVLRTVVSLGFALIDNGTTPEEQATGNILVAFGRDGLRNFFAATNNPAAKGAAVAPGSDATLPTVSIESPAQLRAHLLSSVVNTRVPPAERVELLRMLNLAGCSSVKEAFLGPNENVTSAIETARATLPRFASERALVELALAPPKMHLGDVDGAIGTRLAVSAAAVVGAVIQNERLPLCTVIALDRP